MILTPTGEIPGWGGGLHRRSIVEVNVWVHETRVFWLGPLPNRELVVMMVVGRPARERVGLGLRF